MTLELINRNKKQYDMKNRTILLLSAMLIPFAMVGANDEYDFSITVKDDATGYPESATLRFVILSDSEVSVYKIINEYPKENLWITIPETVADDDGKEYTVVEIGDEASVYSDADYETNKNIKGINIPSTIKSIGDKAFKNLENLEEMNFPEGLTSIGAEAFKGCKSIKEINLPETLSKVGERTFEECSSIKTIKVPDLITYIPMFFCNLCDNLETVYIGENVKSIGFAFQCLSLSEVHIAAIDPPLIETATAFMSNKEITVYVPAGTLDSYKDKWGMFKGLVFEEESDGGQTAGMNSIGRTKLTVTQIGDNSLQICNIDGHLSVYSLLGTKVGEYFSKDVILNLPSGIYILKTDSTVKKVIIH